MILGGRHKCVTPKFRTLWEACMWPLTRYQVVRLRGLSLPERIEKPSLWGHVVKNHC